MKTHSPSSNASDIFHDLLDEIASADLSIVSLDALGGRETPIIKAGPVLGEHRCIQGFVAAKWNV